MKTITLAIATVVYQNSRDELRRFYSALKIAALQSQKAIPSLKVEIIARNNGSSFSIKEILKGVTILGNNENVGYACAMNEVWDYAFHERKTHYVLTANPDGAFHPDAITEMIKNGLLYPKDLHEAIQFPQEHPKMYNVKTLTTSWASGCCMLLSKELYGRVGPLDPNFFLYIEDVDFSWRVLSAGRKIRIVPTAKYFHPFGGRIPSKLREKRYYESGRYLGYKWQNKKFKKWCERNLQKDNLPALPELTETYKQKGAHFQFHFRFAKSRW